MELLCGILPSTNCIQVEFLLDAAVNAYSTELAKVSVQPSPICGNGLCEIGERPGGNSTVSLRTGAATQSLCMPCTMCQQQHKSKYDFPYGELRLILSARLLFMH